MNRDYTSGTSNAAIMFVGQEVEHTPAHKMPTLFVVGIQPVSEIVSAAESKSVQHIYFGANMSFPKLSQDDHAAWQEWANMIQPLIDQNYLCTLDIGADQVEGLLATKLTENSKFIPMISVKLPYIHQLGNNATIKLDDRDFRATNPGVWCHRVHDLMTHTSFTDWSKYTQDEIIK